MVWGSIIRKDISQIGLGYAEITITLKNKITMSALNKERFIFHSYYMSLLGGRAGGVFFSE